MVVVDELVVVEYIVGFFVGEECEYEVVGWLVVMVCEVL